MRRQVANSIYGLLDYAAYPFGMLALAPIVLRHLGAAQYGIWTVTAAVVSFASILASGFGDATIQQVATRRGTGDMERLLRTVRVSAGIQIALGILMALVLWSVAPFLASRLAMADPGLYKSALWCLRIAAATTSFRSIETVCITTQRAFDRYGAAVRISIAARLLSLGAAALLAIFTRDVVEITGAAAAFTAIGLIAQIIALRQFLNHKSLAPSFDPAATRELLSFGTFTWLLSASGVVFSQADRLIAGASVGASDVVTYALCAQMAQPIYGLTAAGLHFLFPYFARIRTNVAPTELRKTLLVSLLVNTLLVAAGAGLLLAFSREILHLLATDAIARACVPLLPAVLVSPALLAFNVTGTYALLALGRVRFVALVNVAAAVVLLFIIGTFLSRYGITAIVGARFIFAVICLLVYVPLLNELRVGAFRLDGLSSRETATEEA